MPATRNRSSTVEKAIAILFQLAEVSEMGLGELSEKLELDRTVVHRLLSTLKDAGLVEQRGARNGYRLGIKLAYLGGKVLARVDLRETARPLMEELTAKVNENVNLAILDDDRSLCIERIKSNSAIQVSVSYVGNREPLYCTAIGKVLLAFQPDDTREELLGRITLERRTFHTIVSLDIFRATLDEIRSQGYAFDWEENIEGVRCIAAPIRGSSGDVVAAISVAGATQRLPGERLQTEVRAALLKTATEISQRLGYNQDPVGC